MGSILIVLGVGSLLLPLGLRNLGNVRSADIGVLLSSLGRVGICFFLSSFFFLESSPEFVESSREFVESSRGFVGCNAKIMVMSQSIGTIRNGREPSQIGARQRRRVLSVRQKKRR